MVLHDPLQVLATRINELEAIAEQISLSLKQQSHKISDLIVLSVTLLESFKFQATKFSKLHYCDHELAFVSYKAAVHLVAQLRQRMIDGSTSKWVEDLVSTIERYKVDFDTVRDYISDLVFDPCELDILERRFAQLRAKASCTYEASWKKFQHCDSISSSELNDLMRKSPEDILMIDFRTTKEYNYSHINFLNIVNVEPSAVRDLFLNKLSPVDSDLESSLSRKLDEHQLLNFRKRSKFQLIVIYNLRFGGKLRDRFDSLEYSLTHKDDNGLPSRSPFQQLIQLLMFQNSYISTRLRRYPLYLKGGLEDWCKLFGQSGLVNKSSLATKSPVSDSSSSVLANTTMNESLYLRNFSDYLASAKSSLPASASGLKSDRRDREWRDSNSATEDGSHIVALDRKMAREALEAKSLHVEGGRSAHAKALEATKGNSSSKYKKTVNKKHSFSSFATGLTNLGNSCYMNCILQCLSSTPHLAQLFLPAQSRVNRSSSYKDHINMDNHLGSKGVITTNFAKLLAEMFNNDGKYFSPHAFKTTVGALSPGRQFATTEQQDCIEFLNFILDGLHEDLNQRRFLNAEEKASISDLTPAQEKAREVLPVRLASTIEWERYLKLNFSVIVDYFQGQYLSQLKCLDCGMTSTTYNAFSILSLPIRESVSSSLENLTIMKCLEAFTETELLDDENKWHCPRCQKFTRLTKKLTITRFPQVLVIHLKRFKLGPNGFFKKLDTTVHYPVNEVLDLTSFWPKLGTYVSEGIEMRIGTEKEAEMIESFPNRAQVSPFRYQLYAVVNHFGNLTTGHYTAYVKKTILANETQQWYHFDDAKVRSNCKDSEVLNKNAYCLFFLRVD